MSDRIIFIVFFPLLLYYDFCLLYVYNPGILKREKLEIESYKCMCNHDEFNLRSFSISLSTSAATSSEVLRTVSRHSYFTSIYGYHKDG